MMKLFVLFLLSQQCFALKIQQVQTSSAMSFYRDHPKCIDSSTEATKPIMEAIQEFWPSKKIEPIPTALTVLASMRFGGLLMKFPKEVVFDHDFDFLLVDQQEKKGSDWTVNGTLGMINEFGAHLLSTKGIKSKACQGAPDIIGLKPGEKSNGAWNFFMFVDKKTELWGHGPFQTIVDAHWPSFIAKPVNAVVHAVHATFDKVEQSCDFDTNSYYKWPTSFAMLHYWVDLEHRVFGQVNDKPVLDSKPFLLAGVAFKNLYTHEMIAEQVNNVLCSNAAKELFGATCQFGTKTPDICKFALLGAVVFDSDGLAVSNQEDADFLLKDCARGLNEKGFMSFQHCHETPNTKTSA